MDNDLIIFFFFFFFFDHSIPMLVFVGTCGGGRVVWNSYAALDVTCLFLVEN